MNLIDAVTQEMVRMLARQLDYSPSADELPLTAQVMVDDLTARGLTDVDANRVVSAFRFLGPRTQRWPTSLMIIENLPHKLAAPRLTHDKPKTSVNLPNFASAIGKGNVLRTVFKPGENYGDYLAAYHASDMPLDLFEAKQLAENGWTAEKERVFRYRAHQCRLGHLSGATPEQIATFQNQDDEAIAERAAIQVKQNPMGTTDYELRGIP